MVPETPAAETVVPLNVKPDASVNLPDVVMNGTRPEVNALSLMFVARIVVNVDAAVKLNGTFATPEDEVT